jgi:protein SCO1
VIPIHRIVRLASVGVLAVALAACTTGGTDEARRYADIRTSPAADGWRGAGLDEPYRMPEVMFTDTEGRSIAWPQEGTPWPVTVVLFAYTNCPDVCATQLADLTAARRGLPADLRERVGLVMITTDPARDDAASLRAYLDRFDRGFIGLRSDDDAVLGRAADALAVGLTGIEARPDRPDGQPDYEVGHGAQLIGFDSTGAARVLWLPGTPVADIRADLERLAR